ncbi:MAG: serine hydrolase, partial [Proteobacteria bacterium]|nr:serine hydrolase [Pseudomonadota bacterium]
MFAKEGYLLIGISLVISVILGLVARYLGGVSGIVIGVLAALPFLFTLYFFRDPARVVPNVDAYTMLSPADGTVVIIEEVDEPLYIKGRAAGSVQSTIPDMAKYAAALLARGGGIVTPETFDTMVSPQWCPDRRLRHIGISFFLDPRFGRMTFGHGGGVGGGWNTMLTVVPQEDLALIVHL